MIENKLKKNKKREGKFTLKISKTFDVFEIFRRDFPLRGKSAFTLIEMLVSIAVFMSVMTVAVSSLVAIINVNKKTQDIKSIVDNLTFVIDSISRNARNATNYKCSTDTNGSTYIDNCSGIGAKYFQYKKSDTEYTQYRFIKTSSVLTGEGNIQRRTCSGDNIGCSSSWQSMTAPTNIVNITNMTFYVIGSATEGFPRASRKQPRVIITVEGIAIEKSGQKTNFTLQTTSSQRQRQSNG